MHEVNDALRDEMGRPQEIPIAELLDACRISRS